MSNVAVFRRRLAETQRFTDLPAESRYNLASSTLDDDTLEQTGEPFGAPYGESGFGTSDVLTELLSRDPKYIRVDNLTQYQKSLTDMGYAYDVPVDGNWSPYWAASARRADRDALNTIRSGGSYLSAPAQTVFRYLQYTIPSETFKGLYGIATGIVEDAVTALTHPVEVAEEGGLAGGAAVGAGIGALIAGIPSLGIATPVGAAAGGVIGGVAGFFADFFDDDENEDGDWNRVLGALSPIDEIRSGDAKNLFAALSTIMTASAILKAGSVAVQGVKAAGGLGRVLEPGAFQMAAKGTVEPGLLGQLSRAALKRPVLGGAAVGGLFNSAPELLSGDFEKAAGDFVHGAIVGGAVGLGVSKIPGISKGFDAFAAKAIEGINAAPLARMAASPAGKISQALYTGAVTPTIVARGVSDLSGKSGTAVGRQIERAPNLPAAGLVDLTLGSFVYPERLLPWRGKDVTEAFRMLGSNHELLPFARAYASEHNVSLIEAFREVRTKMGRDGSGTYNPILVGVRSNSAYLQKGLDDAADEAVKLMDIKKPTQMKLEQAHQESRARLVNQILEEAGGKQTGDIVALSPTAQRVIEKAKANQFGMERYVQGWEGTGSTFDNFLGHQEAQEFLQLKQMEMRGDAKVNFTPAIRDDYLTAQDFERWGGVGEEAGTYERLATNYKKAVKAVDKAEKKGVLPPESQLLRNRTDAADELDKLLVDMRDRGVVEQNLYDTLRPGGMNVRPIVDGDFISELKEGAKLRPREIESLRPELDANGLERYIAVETGENMINYAHFMQQAEIEGLTEYSRHRGFFDTIASLGTPLDRMDVGRMRYQSITRALDKTLGELVTDTSGLNGKSAANDIYSAVRRRYDERALQQGEKLEIQRGTLVKRTDTTTGRVRRELFKVDPRDLKPEDLVEALGLDGPGVLKEGVDVYDAAHRIKRSLHVGAAFGADIAHPIATARMFASGLRVNGLPQFNEAMRTMTVVPRKVLKKGMDLDDKSLWGKFTKGSYGYIPQNLRRMHMALMFSLNPSFDLSRYMEAMAFGKLRGGDIPVKMATNAPKFVSELEEGFISPLTGERVFGKEAVEHMHRFGDKVLYGRNSNEVFDELQYRLINNGFFGFKPREVENGQAFWLGSRKAAKGELTAKDYDEIRDTVMRINQYGSTQTALGNSAHFIFFPFLFSRKQLSALMDYPLAGPARNLLIHEGMRRWYSINDDESLSSKFSKFMERHLPLAQELERINNLAYGISPGRFFLEGMMDKDTEGKVTQALASFFLPGGVHQPIADTAGQAAEVFKNFFTPVVLVDDGHVEKGTDRFRDLAERLVPAYRDIDRWFFDQERSGAEMGLVGAQITALTQGSSPYTQMSDYLDAKKVMGASLESTAQNLGYSSWESLRNASPELAKMVNDLDLSLGEEFPEGKVLANNFTNKEELKEQVLYHIANKDQRTEAEDAISVIGMAEQQAKDAAGNAGLTQEEVLRAVAPLIRKFALELGDDRQFNDLWDELFKPYYGPLRIPVAAVA